MADSDKDAEKLEDNEESSSPDSQSDRDVETSGDADDIAEGKASADDADEQDSDEDEQDSDEDEQDSDEDEDVAVGHAEDQAGISPLLVAVFALAIGAGGGWFGHQFQMKKLASAADAAVEGEGDAARGPCKDWEAKICAELGDKAFACSQAKTASSLLPGSACKLALTSVPQTVAQVRAARASCDSISSKLCSELGEETKSCEMVKTQTPSFPPAKCDEMMKNYDKILSQLQMREKRGGAMGGRPPGHPGMGQRAGAGGPPGARGPGSAMRPPTPMSPPTSAKGSPSTPPSAASAPAAKKPAAPKAAAPKAAAPKAAAPKAAAPKAAAPKAAAPKAAAPGQ